MVKCPRCGYENSSSSVYCDNCAYRLSDSDGNRINNTKRESSWNMGTGKKIILVLSIIVIALLLFSLIYNFTQPTSQESLNVITDDGSYQKSASYPYKAVIQCNGSWYAEMGDPNYPTTHSGNDAATYALDCAAWDRVSINAEKYNGEGELKVQLLKNGEVVAENSTANGSSSVVINYNY